MRLPAKLFAVLSLVLWALTPRFNQQDWLLGTITGTNDANQGDAARYEAVTLWFNGTPTESLDLAAPFTDRPFVPALASLLPLDAMTSLNLINGAAVLVACIATFFSGRRIGLGEAPSVIAAALLGLSFPVLYYGTIGYVDPVVVCMLALGLLVTLHERWGLALVIAAWGILVKESVAISGLVSCAWLLANASNPKQRAENASEERRFALSWCAAILAAMALAYVVSRNVVPESNTSSWVPTIERTLDNLRRPRSLASVALTLGLPALILVTRWMVPRSNPAPATTTPDRATRVALITGVTLVLVLTAVGLATSYLDGRVAWGSQPYLVLLAAVALGASPGPAMVME